jgi:hypothetical protein
VTTPDAQTVHTGHGVPYPERQRRINAWLTANGIDPNLVVATRPVYVLALPNGTINGGIPWLIDVIVFHQFYVNPNGARERDFIAGDAVMFQRTVPLQVPFPTDSEDDEGTTHGEADREAAQEPPQEQVRDARETGVPHRHKVQGQERPRQGEPARNESTAEEGASRGHQAVPQPEEVRRGPEEEVGAQ